MRVYSQKVIKKMDCIKKKLKYCNIEHLTANIGANICFVPIEDDRKGFSTADGYIFIDEKYPWELQLFIIAHELGHLILHHDRFAKDFEQHFNGTHFELEKEANDFAILLLANQYEMDPEKLRINLMSEFQLNI